MTWSIFGATVSGMDHAKRGCEAQDALATNFRAGPDGTPAAPIVLAVADGAGSRRRSAIGAHLAAQAAVDYTSVAFERSQPLSPDSIRDGLDRAMRRTVDFVVSVGPELGRELSGTGQVAEFASTLAIALVAHPYLGLSTLGDCFGVYASNDGAAGLFPVPAPDLSRGHESAVFTTSASALDEIRTHVVWAPGANALAISTDGLEDLALVKEKHVATRPRPEFLDTLFGLLRSGDTEPGHLAGILANPKRATNDDATLVIALKPR